LQEDEVIKRRIFSYSIFFWTFVLGMLIFASAGNAATESATFTTSTYPFLGNNHIAADLNGDGKVDLAGTGTNAAAIMLGNGDGTFQAKIGYPVGGQAQDLAVGDFNGDGKMDLVVTINTPEISLSLLTGNGDGTFNAPVNFPNTSGFDSPAVVATDLNNDGKLDVVIAHQIGCFTAPCTVSRIISIMLGNGNGTFQPTQTMDVGTGMSRIAVGDFNQDGMKDLGISGDRAQVYILLGVGNGTFVQQPTITLISDNPTGVDGTDIDVADFNLDAVQDLVVAIGLNGSRTAILIGNGDGTFGQPLIITDTTLSVPHYQAVADYNLDGFPDLAIALGNGTGGLMEILNGNGNGTFQAPTYYLVPPPQSSIGGGTLVAGHFNADSKPDIALQVVGANPALKVLINTSGPPSNTATPTATSTAGPTATATTTPTNTGFRSPAANAANSGGDGNGFESNPANAHADDTANAVDNNSGNGTSTSCTANAKDKHRFFNYGLAIPTGATINGIEVRLDARADSTAGSPKMCLQLSWNGGSTWTAAKQTGTLGTSMGTFTLGSATDTWGRAWSPADFADANFRVRVINVSSSTSRDFFLDWVAVRVTYTGGATPTSAPPTATPAGPTPTGTATPTSTPPGPTPTATAATPTPTQSPPADTVAIQRAEYIVSQTTLRVEATSTNPNATLQVYVTATNSLIGALTNKGDGRYEGQLSWPTNPENIRVVSNFGGVATKTVTLK
jgi:hypothetical protein